MPDFALQRRMMVDGQLRTFDIMNPAVLSAMGDTPREDFVAPCEKDVAYIDRELAMIDGHPRRQMSPMVFARLLQAAEIAPADIVLDVGCGSGYSAAVLSRIASSVIALDEDAALVEAAKVKLGSSKNVSVLHGSLVHGDPSHAPFDVIVVEGSIEIEPTDLLAQLRSGGRLVAVWGTGRAGRASVWLKSGEVAGRRAVFNAAAPQLSGFAKKAEFAF